jgi:hypothetical protein
MTVEAKVAFIKYAGNGTASPLAVPFRFLEASHLIVTALTDGAAQILVRGTHYNVAGAGAAAGGTVTPTAPVPIGTSWTISRRTPRSQPTKYDDGFYSAKAQETGLDRQALALQEIGDDVDRAPKLPVEGGVEGQYPIVLGDGSWGFSVGSGGGGAATNVRASITAEMDGQTEFDFSTVLSDTVRAAMNAAGTLPWFSAQGVPLEEDDYSWSQSTWTLTIPDGVKAGEIIGLTNGASYDQGLIDGRNVIGLREGGPGKGVNLVGTKYPLASTAARVLGDSLSDRMPSIWDFFRPDLGDTLDDWSPQLNRAAQSDHDIYIPTARRPQGYDLLSPVTQNADGQMYYGDPTGTGAGSGSEFNIPATFPLDANGVIIIPPNLSERGAGISDIGFRFAQPDTAVRANLIQYPYAIYARGVARMRLLGRNTIYLGWKGLDLTGNNGGLEIGHLRLGCFSKGLVMDGAYDKITVGSIEVWPYGCGAASESAGLYSIYRDGVALGLDIGRVDGFSAGLIATFQQRIRFHAAEGEMAGSEGFGTIAQLHLDGTYGRLEWEGGKCAVGSWYATTGSGDDYFIRQAGGALALGPASFTLGAGTPTGQDLIQIVGGRFSYQGGGIHEHVPYNASLLRQTGGDVVWIGGSVIGRDDPRTKAFFHTSGGRLTLKSPRFDEAGTGSGEVLLVENDDWHDIEINASLSRGHTIPAGTTNGTYKFGSTVIAPALG